VSFSLFWRKKEKIDIKGEIKSVISFLDFIFFSHFLNANRFIFALPGRLPPINLSIRHQLDSQGLLSKLVNLKVNYRNCSGPPVNYLVESNLL